MIKATVTSKKTGRIIKKSYTTRQLLEDFYGEDSLVIDMTECDCEPDGEESHADCDCHEEWDDWELVLE